MPAENPDSIMNHIKERVIALALDIDNKEYDRCHRIGPKYQKDGKTYQKVILRMVSWRCRNLIYINRNRLPFFVTADLIDQRKSSFEFAKEEVKSDASAQRVIEYVFVDENCKLKAKTKSKKYYGFSNIGEFVSLVSWLDKNIEQSIEIVVGHLLNCQYS